MRVNDRGAGEVLGVSRFTVRKFVRERAIPYYRVGRRVVFDTDELMAWLRARRVAPTVEAREVSEP
jgi:excisionase family DNA binding protein